MNGLQQYKYLILSSHKFIIQESVIKLIIYFIYYIYAIHYQTHFVVLYCLKNCILCLLDIVAFKIRLLGRGGPSIIFFSRKDQYELLLTMLVTEIVL